MAMTFDPFTEFDRVASALLSNRGSQRVMPVDLYREENRYVLNADLPGVDPGSIDIDLDGQLLTIRAQRTTGVSEGKKWLSQERPSGSYLRQFSIGEGVDTEKISATYDNGVLSVVIPLSEKAMPRKIAVTASSVAEPAQASITA